jgi:hypothetical protein
MNEANSTTNLTPIVITPTRRLNTKEKKVFDRIVSEFSHLQSSDAEQLTQYAETQVRYVLSQNQAKRNPTVTVPVINRSTGNVTGEKTVRNNTAFATMKESAALLVSLGRRLLIDAHSAEHRSRLLTKRARALAASESKAAANAATLNAITEEQIEAGMQEQAKTYTAATPDTLRQLALWHLTVYLPSCVEDDDYAIYLQRITS